MIEFYPWSQKLLEEAYNNYCKTQKFPILDIELGGACNFNCLYCDTPKYGCGIKYSIEDLEPFLCDPQIKMIFICGLGEPTFGPNESKLLKVLELCKKHSVKCSMFTNLSFINDKIYSYIDLGVLYPIFKLDSFDINKIIKIYNTSNELAATQLNNISNIVKHVNVVNGYTNIAASIVPSSLNICEIKPLIKWCKDNDIFPLIGQLEDAGKGHDVFTSLNVDESMLLELKQYIYDCYGESYSIPICPSVLFGIHIDFEGDIIVDKTSGLSCQWFWLSEPQSVKICNFVKNDIDYISRCIVNYRKSKYNDVKQIYKEHNELIFGGCGGDIKNLLKFYIEKML